MKTFPEFVKSKEWKEYRYFENGELKIKEEAPEWFKEKAKSFVDEFNRTKWSDKMRDATDELNHVWHTIETDDGVETELYEDPPGVYKIRKKE